MNLALLRNREFLWHWLPPLFWCCVVMCLSGNLGSSEHTLNLLKWLLSWLPGLSSAQIGLLNFYFRKAVGHVGNYAFLYFLWFRAFQGQLAYRPGRACLWSLTLCLSLAFLDEGRQAMVPSRGSSLRDVVLDLGGAAAAGLLLGIFWTPRVKPLLGSAKTQDTPRA